MQTDGAFMKQLGKVVLGAAIAVALGIGLGGDAAQAAERIVSDVSARGHNAARIGTDLSAQSRAHRRPPTRVRVHPRYQRLGPNAVRDCTASYVQEFRPSGTVIVPRMHCFWRQG